ncbi:MAG TPA: formyltetrahydrofolate deformylase [Mycobacteriales bacterium]|nr:formyltetrahydrofolate deformylase [Mycobacteriales bacterium]
MAGHDNGELVLTLSCPDRPGIVHAVSGFLAARDCNIIDAQQYGSPRTSTFFLRVHFDSPLALDALQREFASLADDFAMSWQVMATRHRPAVLVLVSRQGHCLNDLLYRWRSGYLPAEIVGVAGNHPDLEPLATGSGVPFHHLPVSDETRDAQERQILDLVDDLGVELVVLARYMQVLSPEVCELLRGRIINIHHSFLPSFRGGRPYEQAYDHGVKLIGATAHYVTADLDEGPIIEQEVARVGHAHTPEALAAVGRDLECVALARAVRWHLEHRVLLDGQRTVVFP